MAINNTTVVPQVIAAAFLVEYRKARVFSQRTNNTWRSSLRSAGDRVIINRPGPGSVSDYSANATITYGNADVGTPVTLTIDKTKAWSLKFDDLQAAMSSLPVLTQQVQESAQELANVVDRDVRSAMEEDSTTLPGGRGPDTSTTAAAAAGDFDDGNQRYGLDYDAASLEDLQLQTAHRRLDLSDVPRTGRWVIVGPYMAELIQKIALANDRVLAGPRDSIGNQLISNGLMGNFAGFDWYVSNNMNSDYTATAASKSGDTEAKPANSAREVVYFGNDTATAFVDQVSRTEQIRLQTTFADAVRGLYSYGSKVVENGRLLKRRFEIVKVPA
ncbi:MAG: hypothetical protein F4219_05795 [Gammaproteobacteria bacterium]|nr:hypothetical protein [Gammaproteobacteria bacterium]